MVVAEGSVREDSDVRAFHPLAVLLTATAAVLGGGLAFAEAPSPLRTIASEGARGSRAIVVAKATASRPAGLALRVSSRPRQRVRGQWLVTCRKSGRSRSARGNFDGSTTLRRTLELPLSSPRRCRVSASAQLTAKGRIRLTLLRR